MLSALSQGNLSDADLAVDISGNVGLYTLYGLVYYWKINVNSLVPYRQENAGPVFAVADLELIVALALVCVSLLPGATISLLAWLHALATCIALTRLRSRSQ